MMGKCLYLRMHFVFIPLYQRLPLPPLFYPKEYISSLFIPQLCLFVSLTFPHLTAYLVVYTVLNVIRCWIHLLPFGWGMYDGCTFKLNWFFGQDVRYVGRVRECQRDRSIHKCSSGKEKGRCGRRECVMGENAWDPPPGEGGGMEKTRKEMSCRVRGMTLLVMMMHP